MPSLKPGPEVRWSAERFADEDDPEAAVQHMEMAWNPEPESGIDVY